MTTLSVWPYMLSSGRTPAWNEGRRFSLVSKMSVELEVKIFFGEFGDRGHEANKSIVVWVPGIFVYFGQEYDGRMFPGLW